MNKLARISIQLAIYVVFALLPARADIPPVLSAFADQVDAIQRQVDDESLSECLDKLATDPAIVTGLRYASRSTTPRAKDFLDCLGEEPRVRKIATYLKTASDAERGRIVNRVRLALSDALDRVPLLPKTRESHEKTILSGTGIPLCVYVLMEWDAGAAALPLLVRTYNRQIEACTQAVSKFEPSLGNARASSIESSVTALACEKILDRYAKDDAAPGLNAAQSAVVKQYAQYKKSLQAPGNVGSGNAEKIVQFAASFCGAD